MADDVICESEHPIHLGEHGRLGRGLDEHVVALAAMVHLVGKAPLTPAVDLVDGAAAVGDDLRGSINDGPDGVLLQAGIENDHDFVLPHQRLTTSLWTRPCRHGAPDGPEQGLRLKDMASYSTSAICTLAGLRRCGGGESA